MNTLSPALRLHLLNAPRLEGDGATIPIARRKAIALLAYLALTKRSHLRDSLAALLWPDSGQSLARANLRHTLFVLKQLLGEELLEIEWESIALKQEAGLWVDVLHFQELLAACQAHSQAPGHAPSEVCAACLPLLLEAVTLPVEEFMSGFSLEDSPTFDDWQRGQQQQLCQALSDALDRLAGYFIQAGDYKAAIEVGRRRLGLDTLDEAAHRQLMQLYAWSGQQGLALRQFEQCSLILAQELEVLPSAQTVRLMQEIQAGRVPESAPERAKVPDERAQAPNGHHPATNGHQPPPALANGWQPAHNPQHNLPMRLPTLVGREQDLHALQAMVQRSGVNLITILGPGGVGKTQVSLHLAASLLDHFADGIFFVSLASVGDVTAVSEVASVREEDLVISAIAQSWGLERHSNRPLLESVQSYLRHKQMLLILDNFEHLIAAAPVVSALLANCEHLRVLVSSREVLHVQGEHLYALAPLALPQPGPKPGEQPSLSAIAQSPAVELFVQRAQAIATAFQLDETNASDIAEICTYLDGLPLAIELVAARIRLLPPRTLRQRLLGASSGSFELLQGGARDAPLRHRTIRETINWSYELLTAAEQRLLRQLSIFAGGCTLEAVERTCHLMGWAKSDSVLEMLASLVNKSLLRQVVQPDGESRFLLLEMIREFAAQQLQLSDEYAPVARAHAEYYAAFAEMVAPALTGPAHLAWIARIDAEQNNFRAGLQWAITHDQADVALRIGGSLWNYWLDRGYQREGSQFLAATLQLVGAQSPTPARARALTGMGAMGDAQGKRNEAHILLKEAVTISRQTGDERDLAVALEMLIHGCALELKIPKQDEFYAEAITLYETVGDKVSPARMRQWNGFQNYYEGNYTAAQATCEETLAIYKEQGYEAGLGIILLDLGRILFQQRKFAEANLRFTEAMHRAQARGDQVLLRDLLYWLGRTAFHQGDYLRALPLLEESLRLAREIGTSVRSIGFTMAFLSEIALAQGDVASTQSLLSEGLTLSYRENHTYVISLLLPRCANLAITHGSFFHAVQMVAAGHALYASLPIYLHHNDQLAFDAPLAVVRPLLSADEFAQAWAAGEQMTMDEAVALALAEISGTSTT